ncbi:MAG: signal peptidase I [Bacteroidetes bacterium]|nr:signal peptidase I [Bacteroidota bacterium]
MFRKIFKLLFWSILIWLFVRVFLFQTFRIPSASMHGNLFEGDYVVINKLAYGTRLPMTPLSFKKNFLDWISIPYFRLWGYSEIRHNDLVAFNFSLTDELPVDLREEYIKRCVGLPGDSLEIKNGIVYVNNESKEPANIYNPYIVTYNDKADSNALKDLGITPGNSEGKNQHLLMSTEQAASLLKTGTLKSVTLDIYDKDYYHPSVFPNFSEYNWNIDHYGPVFIPGEGDSVGLSPVSLLLYQRIIERFEKKTVAIKHDSVFISNSYQKYYTFQQNYYFMVGDNRHNSIDSRHWGFIPESHIIGKASLLLYSKREGKTMSLFR